MDKSELLIVVLEREEYDLTTCDDLSRELEPTYTVPNVVVDMSAVTYFDSTSLGRLVRMRAQRSQRGFPPARLVVPSERIRHLFEIVKFDALWPVYTSLNAALKGDGISKDAPAAS